MLPKEPLPYAQRLRNRIIALGIFATLCFMIGSCIFGGGKKQEVAQLPEVFNMTGNQLHHYFAPSPASA